MKTIQCADFPATEYARRIERVSAAMANAGLDAMVLTDPANLRYLFGFQNLLVSSANRTFAGLFVADRPDDSALYITPDCQDAPQSWCENVIFWTEGMAPPLDERYVNVSLIADRLRALGLQHGRIGMELGDGTRIGMAIERYEALRSALSDATVVDSAEIMWTARTCKSPAEIDMLRRIAVISIRAHRRAIAGLHPGLSERELYCRMQADMFSQGADGLGLLGILFGVDGWRRANMSPTDDRTLADGDWVYLDGGGVLQGYNADLCRMAVLGDPDAQRAGVHQTVIEVQQAMIDAIRPGVPCSDIYRTGRRRLEEAGLGHMITTRSFGHGVGLNVHEMPDLSVDNDEPLREGMVLAIEPWILDPDELGLFNREDMVVVTAHGAEPLNG